MSAPTLICLPPAGAGPSIFRPWLRRDQATRAPSIPGREGRFREDPATDLSRLADRIAVEIARDLPARYGLFGYSMGGTVAFLLARRLAAIGLPAPEAVFVLGALAPDRLGAGVPGLHLLDSDAFWDEIARLGGTPDEILRDPELRDLFEPGLRGDFALCDGYRHLDDGFRLACPVHVFTAEDDHLVGADDAEAWAGHAGVVHPHRLRGGHFLGPDAFLRLHDRIRALWPAAQPA